MLQVHPRIDRAVGNALRHSKHGLLAAAAGRDHPHADLDEADVRLAAGLALCPMHGHFAAAAEGKTRRRGDHRFGKVLHPHVRVLQSLDRRLKQIPVSLQDAQQNHEDIRPGREVRSVIPDHHSREVLLHDVARFRDHLDHAVIHGVHLRMKLQAGDAVPDVDQRRAFVLLDELVLVLQIGQQDDPGIRFQLDIPLLLEVVVVEAVLLLVVEALAPLFQHLFDLLRHLQLQLFHHLDGLADADRIPGLEGTQLVVVTPLHRIVDADDVVADLGNAVCRIDEVVAEIFPGDLSGDVRTVEHHLERRGDPVIAFLLRGGDGLESRLAGRHILHRVVIEHELGFFALCVLGPLVEPLFGLVPEPFELHHLVHQFARSEDLPHLIVRYRGVKV